MALIPLKVFVLLFSLHLLFILSKDFFFLIYILINICNQLHMKRCLKGPKKTPEKKYIYIYMVCYFLSPLELN